MLNVIISKNDAWTHPRGAVPPGSSPTVRLTRYACPVRITRTAHADYGRAVSFLPMSVLKACSCKCNSEIAPAKLQRLNRFRNVRFQAKFWHQTSTNFAGTGLSQPHTLFCYNLS
ncbi:hypothetical protein EVAR_43789_1 [Eumeta japonica]|uniref:Uncharacterized protein n=1 Tax=Eumeta variegata TaxID=151549 RepID=A0A4C1XUQ4_EUMVA|nr:hypothetical protein EVAR_43789_1 [Eumeta japonica]